MFEKLKYQEEKKKLQKTYEKRRKQMEKIKVNKPEGIGNGGGVYAKYANGNTNGKYYSLYKKLTLTELDFNYAEIKKKHVVYEKEKLYKFTWDQLENLDYNHFITNRDDDFRPEDILDIEYDSDDAEAFMEMKQQASSHTK